MITMYAMQRANGDWFALDNDGRLRVPLFVGVLDGMRARVDVWGMRLFKPVALDGRKLRQIVPAGDAGDLEFWLVDSPFTSLKRGRLMERAELTVLLREAA